MFEIAYASASGSTQSSGGGMTSILMIVVMLAVFYFLLIIAFSFFYAYAQFNPVEIANNMKQNGGFIPGLRPGRPSAAYISRVLKNVTVLGAVFLGIVAILPIIVSAFSSELGNMALGGTTLLIVVGVALETVNQLETQLIMRHFKGFLN